MPGALGQANRLCYGHKSVDSIVKWTEPAKASSLAEITYTYSIANLANWAQRFDVQRAFSDIGTTINGTSTTTEVVGLQLTSEGWEVPGTVKKLAFSRSKDHSIRSGFFGAARA
jgi:hypothetical protein